MKILGSQKQVKHETQEQQEPKDGLKSNKLTKTGTRENTQNMKGSAQVRQIRGTRRGTGPGSEQSGGVNFGFELPLEGASKIKPT